MHRSFFTSKSCVIWTSLSLAFTTSVGALELGIPNPNLTPPKNLKAGDSAVPEKWTLADGNAKQCIKWVGKDAHGNEIAHTGVGTGVTLTCQIDVPSLTEKEQAVPGEWTGLLSIDYMGGARKGRASWKLELIDLTDAKKPITSLEGSIKSPANPKKPEVVRLWSEISAETMKGLESKKVELRLSVSNGIPVVISGISLSRLHSAPSAKLLGKANGAAGPDKLGAGSLGFNAMTEHRQRVLTIMNIREDSPADKAGLKAGDKIVGVNRLPLPFNDINPSWDWFYNSHESILGRAVADAWSSNPPAGKKGTVDLMVFKKGKPVTIRCQLRQPMDFNTIITSKNYRVLHTQLVDYLCKNQREDGSWGNVRGGPIRTSFSALALLATQDPAHAPRVKKAVDWFLKKYPEPENFGNLGFWHSSYAGILYCEYYLATGDARVLPRVRAILDWSLSGTHTSKWGMPCLGHGTDGLPYGQKALVAPATHLLVLDSLAEKCGIQSGLWNTLLPYMEHSWSDPSDGGHGSLGYNASYKDKGEFWSRSGLFSMAAHLRGERKDMEDAMIGFMRKSYPWIRNSHAYGEPGGSLGLLALNLCNPTAFKEVMNAYGWWFALAWEPDYGLRFSTPHMGAPYMGEEDLINATYALVLAAPKKSLFITGGSQRDWLDISKEITPISPIVARRDKAGNIELACTLPGPKIRYTTDGSQPSKGSKVYDKPIKFATGGTVKARAYSTGIKAGEVSEFTYGPAKSGWSVLAASGHQDPKEAIRRASYAIDHSPSHSWHTDTGQDSKGLPHFLVIDLGQEMDLRAVKIHFRSDKNAAKHCTVKISSSLSSKIRKIAEAQWDDFLNTQTITLSSPTKARYLRLDFSDPTQADSSALFIREIDVE